MLLRFIDRFGAGARQRVAELARGARARATPRARAGSPTRSRELRPTSVPRSWPTCATQVEDLGAAGQLADEALVARVEDEVDRATRALEEYAAQLRGTDRTAAQVVLVLPDVLEPGVVLTRVGERVRALVRP